MGGNGWINDLRGPSKCRLTIAHQPSELVIAPAVHDRKMGVGFKTNFQRLYIAIE